MPPPAEGAQVLTAKPPTLREEKEVIMGASEHGATSFLSEQILLFTPAAITHNNKPGGAAVGC